jgi:hypothetical protein
MGFSSASSWFFSGVGFSSAAVSCVFSSAMLFNKSSKV